MGHKARTSGGDFSFERIADVMAACMLADAGEDVRQAFLGLASGADAERVAAREARARYLEVLGWSPADDVVHGEAALAAYREHCDEISDVWMLGGLLPENLSPDPAKTFGSFPAAMRLLCGLEHFADDPSGDTAWASTIPSPIGTTEVFLYDHEVGKIDGLLGCSLSDFVASRFEPYDEDGVVWPAWIKRDQARCKAQFERAAKSRHPLWNSQVLFERSQWLLPLAGGEPGYYFARDLSRAPQLADWESERELLVQAPWLASYWLLAHFFLGNERACRQVIEMSEQVPGQATARLAAQVARVLDGDKNVFAKLSAVQLSEIRAAAAKNAIPELLEAASDGEPAGKRLSHAELRAALKTGRDPFDLITEYPSDVDTHDRALAAAAKGDEKLAKLVKDYLRERKDAAYNRWPYRKDRLDPRLSLPFAAAFRAGLRYDSDHDRAHSGITYALGMFDDDHAMDAFSEAIDSLSVDDARLEYVIKALAKSASPRAADMLSRAAWRTFTSLDEARRNQERLDQRREREGMTLDNMFPTKNHLLAAVRHLFKSRTDDAVRLADRLLEEHDTGKILGRRVGDAMRIAGDARLERHKDFILWYIDAVGGLPCNDPEQGINEMNLENFAEAGIAAAKLWPDEVRERLRKLFDRTTESLQSDLDIKAGTLGGLLLIDGPLDEYLGWLERILGNRANPARITPALRAVAEARLTSARDWVLPHVYSKKNDLMAHQVVLGIKAREAMAALGEGDLPEFDEDSKFATSLESAEEITRGFSQPAKYWPSYLCERAVDKKLVAPELCDAIAAWTRDQLRYSADNPWRSDDDSDDGLKALGRQGPRGLQAIASFLTLEHLSPRTRAYLLLMLRLAADEAAAWRRAVEIDVEAAIAELSAPSSAEWMGFLDLLAARVLLDARANAREPLEKAMRWRYQQSGGSHDNLGVDLRRLPYLLAALGPESKNALEDLKSEHANNYYVDEFIDAAIEACAKERFPAPVPADASTVNLAQKLSDYGCRCQLRIDRDGKLATAMDDVSLNLIDQDALSWEVSLPSSHFDKLVQMAELLGYSNHV